MINESVLDLIGNTPMVDVSKLSPNPNVRIIAKLESQNPFGSVKDRIAKHMIEQAEKDGRAAARADHHRAVVGQHRHRAGRHRPAEGLSDQDPDARRASSIERRQMLEVFGAEIILTPGEEGSNGAVRRAQEMAAEHPEWCFLYQYGNDANPHGALRGHRPRDLARLPRDHPLRRRPGHQRHADGHRAVPEGAATPTSRSSPSSRRSASGSRACATSTTATSRRVFEQWYGFDLLDRKRVVRPRESLEWTRRLVQRVRRVRRHLSRARPWPARPRWPARSTRARIVFIVCDGGWKYLSTGAYTDDLDEAEAEGREHHLLLRCGRAPTCVSLVDVATDQGSLPVEGEGDESSFAGCIDGKLRVGLRPSTLNRGMRFTATRVPDMSRSTGSSTWTAPL